MSKNIYIYLLGGLVSLLSLLTACQPQEMHEPFIQIGSTKADLFGLPKEYRALHPRLEELFACRILFSAQPNGESLAEQLSQGNIEFAIMSAKEYGSVRDPSCLTLIATALNALHQTSRRGYIMVRADSPIKSISACAGKRFAFGFYQDLLTDIATQAALEEAGVSVKKLVPELLLPPPISMEGRLYRGHSVAQTLVIDLTVSAGVVDELDFHKMPDSGGNFILGPSKDQLRQIGETIVVPECVVVAGPSTDTTHIQMLKDYLFNHVKDDKRVCEQLGICGFIEPRPADYASVRNLLQKHPEISNPPQIISNSSGS